jgi:hypothetical protein
MSCRYTFRLVLRSGVGRTAPWFASFKVAYSCGHWPNENENESVGYKYGAGQNKKNPPKTTSDRYFFGIQIQRGP